LVLRPERSRTLAIWWLTLHVLLATASVELDLPVVVRAALVAALAAHAVLRWERSTVPTLIGTADGRWALPDSGVEGLRLGARTRYTAHWVRLVLVAEDRTFDILLLKDQLAPSQWRALAARLGAGPPPASGDLR
jgi:hypothetical protein